MKSNFLQFIISVVVVAVMSKAAKETGFLNNNSQGDSVSLTIKGFLTFFSLALAYFPATLMLSGIEYRNKFFKR
jgi:hypothetical protein